MRPLPWESPPKTWAIDFEFSTRKDTIRPVPSVFAALEIHSGRVVHWESNDLRSRRGPPFDVRKVVVLAYAFTAEGQCFERLGWRQPEMPLDLYAENVARLNGYRASDLFIEDDGRLRFDIVTACRLRGVSVSRKKKAHKHAMQKRADEGEPFTDAEWRDLTTYCIEDVRLLADLYHAMRPEIDIPAALVRGRFMIAVGQHMDRGIPVNRIALERYLSRREDIRRGLIEEDPIASQFYHDGKFSRVGFWNWTERSGIGWPRESNGAPGLKEDTLRLMAKMEPRTAPLVKLFGNLNKLKRLDVPLYPDDRIRPNYWPFRTTSGRNGAKASKFLLLKDKWLRGFVQAPPGRALAQLDYKCEELFVLAMLSGDQVLLADLEGDPYLRLAISLGLVPADATKEKYGDVRDKMKPILLGSTYGMTPHGIAAKTGFDLARSREIHAGLKRRYRVAWEWLGDVIRQAYRTRHLVTPMGWPFFIGPGVEKGTLQNHMIQATAADIIHVTCVLTQDVDVNVISTLHDSAIVESNVDQIGEESQVLAATMSRAAQIVIGYPIPVEEDFRGEKYFLKGSSARFFDWVVSRSA
jgi:hypothetical protein